MSAWGLQFLTTKMQNMKIHEKKKPQLPNK